MRYQKTFPIKPLQKYIKCFWTLEDGNAQGLERTFKIIPDGLPGLIFQQKRSCTDQNGGRLPQSFLYGQTTKHSYQYLDEGFKTIGVYFQPTALKSIFGIDAMELTDHNVNLSDLGKYELSQQLSDTISTSKQIEILSTFFLGQINQQKTASESIDIVIGKMTKGENLCKILSALNMSERTLERHFLIHVGVPPKRFSRIIRFQSALKDLRVSKNLTQVSFQNEYFDQSHFNREFKEFTGTTPTMFMSKAKEKVANYPEWKP